MTNPIFVQPLLLALCIFQCSLFGFCQEEKKLALVIGNANYLHRPLKNADSDAKLVDSTLLQLGFDVFRHDNLESRRSFINALRAVEDTLSHYDVLFIYYAGHAVQINGTNYLLPTQETFRTPLDVEDYGVSLQRVIRYLEAGHDDLVSILVLDACRDDPFAETWSSSRTIATESLAPISPPSGTLVAYSTASGMTAADGKDQNSIYTAALCKHLLSGGLAIEQVFNRVRKDVLLASDGNQRPVENSTLIGAPFIINKTALYELEKTIEALIQVHAGPDGYELNPVQLSRLIEFSDAAQQIDPDGFHGSLGSTLSLMNRTMQTMNEDDLDHFQELHQAISELGSKDLSQQESNYVAHLQFLAEYSSLSKADSSITSYNRWIECHQHLQSLRKLNSDEIFYFNHFPYGKKWMAHAGREHSFITAFTGQFNRPDEALEAAKEWRRSLNRHDSMHLSEDFLRESGQSEVVMRLNQINAMDALKLEHNLIATEWQSLNIDFPQNSNLMLARATKLMALRELNFAESLIKDIIIAQPKDPEPYLMLYVISLMQGDLHDALLNLDVAIEKLTRDTRFYVTRNILELGLDDLTRVGYLSSSDAMYLWEVRLLRAELLADLNQAELMCEEIQRILEDTTQEELDHPSLIQLIQQCQ